MDAPTDSNISSEEGLDNVANDDDNNSNEDDGGTTTRDDGTLNNENNSILASHDNDDDNNGPNLPPAVIEDINNEIDKSQKRIDSITNTQTPPTPFNYTEFEKDDDDDVKNKMNQKPAATTRSGRDSIYEPSREDIESEGRPLPPAVRRTPPVSMPRDNNTDHIRM